MTTAITLATPDDAPRLLGLLAACHVECDQDLDDAHRAAALAPLLDGSPLGAAWLFGPSMSPTGYVIITFSWSMQMAGMEAFVDELYIRPNVRKRGIASEVLSAIAASLHDVGVTAMHAEIAQHDKDTRRLFTRAHFQQHPQFSRMTRVL